MKNMKMVILDFDGTLVSSMDHMDKMIRGLLSKYGVEATEEMISEIKPKGFINGSSYIKSKYKIEASEEEIVNYMRSELSNIYTDIIPLKPYVLEFVNKLSNEDIKICIATANQKDFVEAAVRRTGLDRYLDYLVTIKDVNSTKDSPRIFQHCSEKFDIEPRNCVVFEDSLVACEVAKEAGFYVVGVRDGANKGREEVEMRKICDDFIDDFSQALKMISN